jgi:hypothetical protein
MAGWKACPTPGHGRRSLPRTAIRDAARYRSGACQGAAKCPDRALTAGIPTLEPANETTNPPVSPLEEGEGKERLASRQTWQAESLPHI